MNKLLLALSLLSVGPAHAATLYNIIESSQSITQFLLSNQDTGETAQLWAVTVGRIKVSTMTVAGPSVSQSVVTGAIPFWRPSATSSNCYAFKGLNENGTTVPAKGEWVKCP